MQSKVLLGNGKVNLIHELSVLAFQTLKNLPAAPPSGGTAGTGGCKQFTPPLLHCYTPCSRGGAGVWFCQNFFILSMLLLIELLFDEL